MISSFKMIFRSLIRWFSKLFVNKLIFVVKYVIWVILLLLMLEERVWILVLYEIVNFDVCWVVFFLVEFVDWKGNIVNFKKFNVYLIEIMLIN